MNANCDNNVVIGHYAGDALNGAGCQNNVLIGTNTGSNDTNDLVDADNNVLIGHSVNASSATASNQIVIGASAAGVADDSVTLGNASVTAVYAAQDGDAVVYCGGINMSLNQPAAQAGSMTSEHLDAYEEGTWTPVWQNGTPSDATYVKIGRLVYASGQFTNSSGSATTGHCSGLPFNSAIDGSDGGGTGYHDQDTVAWNVLKTSSDGFRFYTGSTQQQLNDGAATRFHVTYMTAT
jgi:hypothetical protein